MHVCVSFVAKLEPTESMKLGEGTFDEPACFCRDHCCEPPNFGKQGPDVALAQTLPMWLGGITGITCTMNPHHPSHSPDKRRVGSSIDGAPHVPDDPISRFRDSC